MSRTDAHRPARVRIDDHPDLTIEVHDHTDGVCQLAAVPSHRRGQLFGPSVPHGCHVVLDPTVRVCSCGLCTGRPWRRADERSRRTLERAWLRAAARGLDDVALDALEARLGAYR